MKTKLLIVATLLGTASFAMAQDGYTPDQAAYAIDNMFLFVAAVLVLLMQAGFAMLESGMSSSTCTINVLSKNLMDMCIGVAIFWIVGYGLMYPGDSNGFLGFGGFGVTTEAPEEVGPGVLHPQIDYLFQAAFAAAAATIVSGAIAGRMNFLGYLFASLIITGFLYPIQGMWKWGGGFLDGLGYVDFAGSMVVHGMGGFAALLFAWILTKKADLTMAFSGVLGGLVAICCACDAFGNGQTLLVGALAGIIVVACVYLLEKLKIDDPVGAFPVHGAAGAWGVLAPALFGLEGFALLPQLIGFAVIAAFAFVTCYALFFVLKMLGICRVSEEIERESLDLAEHGSKAYNAAIPDPA